MDPNQVVAIPSVRRVVKDTKANLDALTGLQDEDLAFGTDTTVLYRQNGAGAANWEAITTPAPTISTNGNYTGNNTVNRAIPHGLSVAPKIVLIAREGGSYQFRILIQ